MATAFVCRVSCRVVSRTFITFIGGETGGLNDRKLINLACLLFRFPSLCFLARESDILLFVHLDKEWLFNVHNCDFLLIDCTIVSRSIKQ